MYTIIEPFAFYGNPLWNASSKVMQISNCFLCAFPRFTVFFYYLLLRGILLSWGRRIAIYNSRKRNYYSPRIENYHFSPDIFFTSIHACYSLVVHHFFVIKSHSRDLSNRYYLFFPLSKEGNSFARLLFSKRVKRWNRCIRAWNRKFPTYYFNHRLRYFLQLLLHLGSS